MTFIEHRQLSDAEVWTFLSEGCSLPEIADYAGVPMVVAQAMTTRARLMYAVPVRAAA